MAVSGSSRWPLSASNWCSSSPRAAIWFGVGGPLWPIRVIFKLSPAVPCLGRYSILPSPERDPLPITKPAGSGRPLRDCWRATKAALPSFKQYRESDGRFHFKLVDAQGRLLLQSQGFASPKDAGAAIGRLQKEGHSAWQAMGNQLAVAEGVATDDVAEALQQLVAASAGG